MDLMVKLKELQDSHPKITFESFKSSLTKNILSVEYHYVISSSLDFKHKLSFDFADLEVEPPSDRSVFLLGVTELVSYWKLTCSPVIEIKCGVLSQEELEWFKSLYHSGLGEFFYLNELDPNLDFQIVISSDAPNLDFMSTKEICDKSLVMVGGGKDSLVTLRSFKKQGKDFRGFVVNPIPQALQSIELFSDLSPVSVQRTISSKLLKLPKGEYLNGHVPFSAILAFIGLVASECTGFKHVVTSNESTANEGNVSYQGLNINHQYSKTHDFELAFRELMRSIRSDLNYYSFLRPLNELQITGLLSKHKASLATFLSCNKAQTIKAKTAREHSWCGACPKCVFTFLSLACFLSTKELEEIWSPLPLKYVTFFSTVKDLVGLGTHKPFECVGSYEESRTGFRALLRKISKDTYFRPIMDQALEILEQIGSDSQDAKLEYWDNANFLREDEVIYLKSSLKTLKFNE